MLPIFGDHFIHGQFFSENLNSTLLVGNSFRPIMVAFACFLACFSLDAARGSRDDSKRDEGPFNKFAGKYSGQVTLSSFGVSGPGTGSGVIRGGKAGGKLVLRSSVSANGSIFTTKRNLRFKRRSFQSTLTFIPGSSTATGTGGGRYSTNPTSIRYTDRTLVQQGGEVIPFQITGNVSS